MPTAIIDGISTRYDVVGEGPPLLMFSPGGFDATLEKWTTLGVYGKTKMFEQLTRRYQCIVFDRRETGQSGGRVERVTWSDYVAQGKGLLDHLGIDRAHLMGGCMGCAPVVAFAVAHPQATLEHGAVLARGRREIPHQRPHALRAAPGLRAAARLAAVVALAKSSGKSFGEDPRGGPWAAVIRSDAAFADAYAKHDVEQYKLVVTGMARRLLDRDTAPGRRARRPVAPEHPRARSFRAATRPTRPPPRAISRSACRTREYWDVAARRTDRGHRPGPPARIPRQGQRRAAHQGLSAASSLLHHMIIDIHCHYTTEPQALHLFRDKQLAGLADPARRPAKTDLGISDEALIKSVQPQLKFQKERGSDLTVFSPRAAGMAHHVGTEAVSQQWARMSQRLDPSHLHAAAGQLRRRRPAAAVSRRLAEELPARARARGQ